MKSLARIVIGAGYLLLTSAATGEPARLLTHDGVSMTLSVTRDDLEISYLEVPPALRELGVTVGMPLVRGRWDGAILNGQAFLFAEGCAPIAYPVRGVVDRANVLVVIGPAPSSCGDSALTWNESAVLRFNPPQVPPSREREKKPKVEKVKSAPKAKPKPKPEVRRPSRPAAPAPSPWAPYPQQWRW